MPTRDTKGENKNMYFRYEMRHKKPKPGEWEGVFQFFNPSQRRKWYCLAEPKWYEENPEANSRAWFTEHGFAKWMKKMETMLQEFDKEYYEVRLLTATTLDNLVFEGKTQVIELL